MKLLAIIDELSTLNPKKDSSIVMFREAALLGLEIHTCRIKDLMAKKNEVFAISKKISLTLDKESWYQIDSEQTLNLESFKIVLMRKDPPFNQTYIYATYLLELAEKKGVIISNRPNALRDANEKAFIMHFPKLIPQTCISANIKLLKDFHQNHKPTIAKPLDGMGGRSIFYLNEKDDNLNVVLETLTDYEKTPIMIQRFVKEIKETGDKRILIIGDKIIPYALARIPNKDDIRGNLAKGASAKVIPLSEKDKALCQTLIPVLKEKGLHFVGVDILGHYVTEINVTSPTCIQEIEKETGLNIARDYIKYLLSL